MKPFKTIDEQIQILQNRGLQIPDVDAAKSFLFRNNYYRVSGYSLTLRKQDTFYPGTTFQNIIDIYEFDRKLRHILLTYLEIIEVTFKSIYAYEFCQIYSPTAYCDSEHFTDLGKHQIIMNKVNDLCKSRQGDEAYLRHFLQSPQEPVPLWAYIDLFTISNISVLYSISESKLQKCISKHYNFSSNKAPMLLQSAMKNMTILRNLCAHESRLFNRLFQQKPRLMRKDLYLLPKTEQGNSDDKKKTPDNSRLFGFLLLMRQLLQASEFSSLKSELISLCESYPFVQMRYYGFCSDWDAIL